MPLGFFLLEHTWANTSALRGQEAYLATVESLERIPLLVVVEIAFVFLPLAYHAAYGVWMMRERVAAEPKPFSNRALAVGNRIAAGAALVFIAWHFWEFRIQAWRHALEPNAFYATLAWRLSSTWHGFPVRAVLYLIGAFSTVFHFACGTWSYAVTSGLLATARQKSRAAWGCLALGTLLFGASAATVVSLATGIEFTTTAPTSSPCTPQQK